MSFDSSNLTEVTLNDCDNRFRHQVSSDFDEQASLLKGWNQDYSQISAGTFQGFVSEIHLDDVSLFLEFTNQRLYQQGCLHPDTIAIGVPLNSIVNGMFCGSACEQNAIHVYSGSNGFEFVSPDGLMIGLIVVSRHKLMQLLSADDQYFLNLRCKQAHIAKVSYPIYFSLVQFLQSTFQALKFQPDIAKNTDFTEDITASALKLVTDSLLDHSNQTLPSLMPHRSWQVLTSTREIINLRQDNPISVAELCESLAISRRSLQYHFEHTLNTSPVAYLRAERLNAVRHMMKEANSVTEAATFWGFWHFGHFSHEYKKMFGELPSVTFKRLHAERES
ncbi:MAG: helix-turn-helix domain-containing protein [Methylophilus sp.]|nr:helix-turn-helix domain-containing protein [Methylophilus sp.]